MHQTLYSDPAPTKDDTISLHVVGTAPEARITKIEIDSNDLGYITIERILVDGHDLIASPVTANQWHLVQRVGTLYLGTLKEGQKVEITLKTSLETVAHMAVFYEELEGGEK
jgi:hypothetical protein